MAPPLIDEHDGGGKNQKDACTKPVAPISKMNMTRPENQNEEIEDRQPYQSHPWLPQSNIVDVPAFRYLINHRRKTNNASESANYPDLDKNREVVLALA